MDEQLDFYIPTCEEFRRGYEVYNRRERKGPIYFESLATISANWNDPAGMANGVSILVRSWNYLFANFDFDQLFKCIDRNLSQLSEYRSRDISSFNDNDIYMVKNLFDEFLDALKRRADNRKSPVSVAKALNPLAPNFFPIWDQIISEEYGCGYSGYGPENASNIYIRFCKKMKLMAGVVKNFAPNPDDRSLLKRIDEYNYSKYTKDWI